MRRAEVEIGENEEKTKYAWYLCAADCGLTGRRQG
jgi:hypothetical protein